MKCTECQSAQDITVACQGFYAQLEALNDKDAIENTSSMFNSIRGAAATYNSKLARKVSGSIWYVENDLGVVVGLMRIKDEGSHYHLENLVGIPKAGGGAALLELAKEISKRGGKDLKLEAADEKLIKYYQDRCFTPEREGSKQMVWKHNA